MDRTVRLGDVEVPRVGLGTNRLAHTPQNVEFIREAVAAGLRHIDTAYLYAGGESEQTIGEALSPVPEGVVVATKGGYRPGESEPGVLREQIAESLRRLRTQTIGLYYLHKVHPQTPIERSLEAIAEAQEQGQIAHIGVSNATVEEIERARKVVTVAAVQNHYNMASREHEDVLDYCDAEGIVFVPYFPLHTETPPEEALTWLLERSPVVLPIPGTLSIEHLKDNLAVLA